MWNLQTNKQKNPKLINTENRLMITRGKGGWRVSEIGEEGKRYEG